MTIQVNVQEAKTQLSRLLARAASGEDIVIARNGKRLVRLVPVEPPPERELGFLKLEKPIPDDFWDPMSEDDLALWE